MFKRWLAGILVAMMVVQPLGVMADTTSVSEDAIVEDTLIEENVGSSSISSNIANPRIMPDETMIAGQKVTYDCIWFGSYPQAEVVPDKSQYTAIKEKFLEDGDLIEDASLYSQLQSATYNSKNETTIGGTRYKRMLKSDATYGTSGSRYYYNWSDSTTYHYFKYEPIKWRVIEKDSSSAILLADKGLDDQEYNKTDTNVTWETCTLRDYLNSTFYDNAFNTTEKGMIIKSTVENANNLYYGTSGGNNTSDNVFLLAEKEVYKTNNGKSFTDSTAAVHGFVDACRTFDEARRAGSTVFSNAMGTALETINSSNKCVWWMRSPGYSSSNATHVNWYGGINSGGINVNSNNVAVRPAIKINLTGSIKYAGTVCTDGTVNETAKPGDGGGSVTPTPTPTQGVYDKVIIDLNDCILVDDYVLIDKIGTDSSKLLLKGKSGIYDPSTGSLKAVKKGTAKLYYLDGKKKIVVCTIKVEQPKLKASLKMKTGKTKKLKLSGTKRTDIVWTSSDESVASMSGGIISAKKVGECDIIAKIGKHEWKCHVMVK